ncbi:hypothetical protein [Paenibacillus lautus]|uniref:hypothetical protein n=1 Tax=Paenibacillus lautus TaxID=1401 RepID=UPI001BCCF407|nr:hypothetical protein [Paenibacillus lautus]
MKSGKTSFSADSTIQKKLVSLLDELSDGNANVAQGFLFEPDVVDGAKTRFLSLPTHLLEAGLKPGELFDQLPIQELASGTEIQAENIDQTNLAIPVHGARYKRGYRGTPFGDPSGIIV